MRGGSTTITGGRHRGAHHAGAAPGGGRIVVRRLVRVVAALVSATLLVAMGYYRYSYSDLDRGLHRVAVGGLGHASPAPGQPQVKQVDGSAQNLLIIGSDSRAGLSSQDIKKLHVGAVDGTDSTDTLMVVHVPADGSRATLVSIPRDTYVQIPGFPANKINAAYADGFTYGTDGYPVSGSSSEQQRQGAGLTLLIATVKNLTGLEIDHYVMVSFLGFYNIAKAIGGISVTLCHAVDDTGAYNESHGEGHVGSGFHMSGGHHDLTPVQSLEFVRQRHNLLDSHGRELDDIGREARQRYFLGAAFEKVESADTLIDPGRLSALIDALKSTLTIDKGLSLQTLAHQMLDLASGNIVGQTIPVAGAHTYPAPVGDALDVDVAQVQARVQHWVTATPSSKPAHSSGTTAGHASGTPSGSSSSTGVTAVTPRSCID